VELIEVDGHAFQHPIPVSQYKQASSLTVYMSSLQLVRCRMCSPVRLPFYFDVHVFDKKAIKLYT